MVSSLQTPPAKTISSEVLFVDLDGTLLRTDMLWEGISVACRTAPLKLLSAAASLAKGRVAFKRKLAESVVPDIASLPYDSEVIDFANQARKAGTKVVLATATDMRWASSVAEHLRSFDDVIASDGNTNCKGRSKLALIESYCHDRGFTSFAYIGDATADLPIWRASAEPVVVAHWVDRSSAIGADNVTVIGRPQSRVRALIKLLRVNQWAKNLLVFAPLALGHAAANPAAWFASITAFIVFSLVASSVYVWNDFIDVAADRRHPSKCRRPLADGSVPLSWVPATSTLLLVAAFALSLLLPSSLMLTMVGYFILATAYSIWLKGKPIVDVLVLAVLYTLRIIAGGAATGIAVSDWLLAFSVFLFNSLAFVKRYAELTRLRDNGQQTTPGRGYHVADLSLVRTLGTCSGYMAVVVFAFYIRSATASEMYPNAWALWLICPLLLYWISRIWLKAHRRQLDEDPVVFAMRDRASLTVGLMTLVLAVIAAMPK